MKILKLNIEYLVTLLFILIQIFNLHALDLKKYQLSKSLLEHTNVTKFCEFSKDGKFLVSASWDGFLIIWDLQNYKIIHRLSDNNKLGHLHYITCLQLNNNLCLTGSTNANVTLYNINTGLREKIFYGHSDFITSVDFSHNNKFIASSSYDYKAIVWNLDGTIKYNLKHPSIVNIAKISNDDKYLFTATNNKLYIWDLETGICKKILVGHHKDIISLEISKDNNFFVTASTDEIVIWDTITQSATHTLRGHYSLITCMNISKDSKYILSGSHDCTVNVWDRETGLLKKTLSSPNQGFVISIQISNDNKYILECTSYNALIWDMKRFKLVKTINNGKKMVNSGCFNFDNSLCIAMNNIIKIYN